MAWTSPAGIAAYLGGTVDPADPYLQSCADAAEAFCRRKRIEAGYPDVPDPTAAAPSADVGLAATMYGGQLFRERGSADSFASFDETLGFTQTGAWPRIKQLLGVGKGRVDTPQSDLAVTPLVARRLRWPR